jgi:hypothetical protein
MKNEDGSLECTRDIKKVVKWHKEIKSDFYSNNSSYDNLEF